MPMVVGLPCHMGGVSLDLGRGRPLGGEVPKPAAMEQVSRQEAERAQGRF